MWQETRWQEPWWQEPWWQETRWPNKWAFRHWMAGLLIGVVMSACTAAQEPQKTIAPMESPNAETANPAIATPAAPSIDTRSATTRLTGFSTDGQHYLHLESWRDTGAGIPHATLQIVDIAENTCLKQGCLATDYGESDAERPIAAAENSLLQQTEQLRQTLALTEPTAEKPLPITTRSQTADGTETVIVAMNGKPVELKLKQTKVVSRLAGGTAEKDQAAMQLTVDYDGKQQTLGSLNAFQDGAIAFSIRNVYKAPQGDGVVVLITVTNRAFEGTLGQTLVQGLKL